MNPFVALSIGKGVMDVVGGVQRARAVNSAARQTFRNALIDQSTQNTQNQRQYIERDRAARQSAYDAAMATRASVASARNSGVAGGVRGNTMRALMSEQLRAGARNQSRIQDQRDNNTMAFTARSEAIERSTLSRINNTQTASFGMTDIAKIAINTGLGIAGQRSALASTQGQIDGSLTDLFEQTTSAVDDILRGNSTSTFDNITRRG